MLERKYTIAIFEKGTIKDIEHAIACADQAEKRAEEPWLKKICASRKNMLLQQLAKMREGRV